MLYDMNDDEEESNNHHLYKRRADPTSEFATENLYQ